MGGDNSKESKEKKRVQKTDEVSVRKYNKDWQVVGSERGQNIVRNGNVEGLVNNHIISNRFDPSDEALIYEKRNKCQAPIVKVFDSKVTNRGTGLVPENHVESISELIPHRLSNTPQLTYPESLYTLNESLSGYEHLHDKMGPFGVNSSMIGYTPKGHTKVWCNPNLGVNQPLIESKSLQSTHFDENYFSHDQGHQVSSSESNMVRNIVNVVGDKCEEGQFPAHLRGQLDGPNVGFRSARRIVQQNIRVGSENGDFIPVDHVDLYRNMIKSRGNERVATTVPVMNKVTTVVQQPQLVSNYMFNYIKPEQNFHPTIFASRAR